MDTSGCENEVEDGLPSELQDRLTAFDDSLSEIENIVNKFHGTPISEVHSEISAIDKAKLDLVGAYTMNSLFWMYTSVTGENPKDHGIKQELDRIRGYMNRVKEIEDKAKAPKLDKPAAKRFVRSALWQQAQQGSPVAEGKKPRIESTDTPPNSTETGQTTPGTSSDKVNQSNFVKEGQSPVKHKKSKKTKHKV